MFKHILLPIDGSDLSLGAAKLGIELAQTCGARVYALHVVPAYQTFAYVVELLATTEQVYMEEAQARAAEYLAQVRSLANDAGVEYNDDRIVVERPHEVIIATAAAQHCDLIVMASHGWRGMTRLLLGSETQKVLLKGDVPVLVCH
jgi:nucleotide-binding universal stress UspA family protein